MILDASRDLFQRTIRILYSDDQPSETEIKDFVEQQFGPVRIQSVAYIDEPTCYHGLHNPGMIEVIYDQEK